MMSDLKIKFRKIDENAVEPMRQKSGDAGFDLTVASIAHDEKNGLIIYGSGIAVAIPQGYVGLLFPRSSIAYKDLLLTNSVGIIDSGYRGEIMAKFCKRFDQHSAEYKVGERFAQLIILQLPNVSFAQVDSLDQTERGDGGYGSTGA